MMLSGILGIFRLAIFILQLTNSSGASAGNSWGQRGVVQWTVQRSRTFFKAAIASNTWCTPFYEYWRRSISFIFYSRWYLAATAVIMTFKCEQECCLLTNVKSDSEQNKTWKDNPAVSEQNKTWKDNPAVSWIVSPLSDTYSNESMCLNWFLNEARYIFAMYVLRPGACFRHGVKEIKPVPAHHTCFHDLEQLAERANTRCDVTNLIKWLPSRQDQHEIEQ